ncbi:F-box/LRR-repeat protein 3 [Neodiprion pinetum]|uniref:F-box/LRR-repeat protein 3 n=1 Tax=Neodiprion pinetum TaxID=441929 RepID=UPI001EDD591D|nr:F-box/LRR-repeat protein 3-like [Neodiprion pinetum]XP_046476171.1 F-box/LRR-repeat protein 3-like [Neodiprion pinetum]XP_046476172.1 F-box/LRR-repeat protein 3-like [Neodiprion pinetum]XP_046476174.1 F-box/LRR-repeat protein 3-like [Neodiprion pinetum]
MKMNYNGSKFSWATLPAEALARIFGNLSYDELISASLVCKHWEMVVHSPSLWRTVEFNLSQADNSTNPHRIDYILRRHGNHIRDVSLKTDNSVESAEAACIVLSRLVNSSLKTLTLMSAAKPAFMDIEEKKFTSALIIALDHSPLRSLDIDHTPVDDPSLATLALSTSGTLQLLRIKSCPRLSPRGILALAEHCQCLRELSLSYSLLSDELLVALSVEKHVRLETLRVEAYPESKPLPRLSDRAWLALATHSPNINFVLLSYITDEDDFAPLLASYVPVTHLYFGEDAPAAVVARIGKFCPRLVELVISRHSPGPIDQALISAARGCPQLAAVGLGDCELTCSGFVDFVVLCAERLRELYVYETSLLEDSKYDVASAAGRVSSLLGRSWAPEYIPMW